MESQKLEQLDNMIKCGKCLLKDAQSSALAEPFLGPLSSSLKKADELYQRAKQGMEDCKQLGEILWEVDWKADFREGLRQAVMSTYEGQTSESIACILTWFTGGFNKDMDDAMGQIDSYCKLLTQQLQLKAMNQYILRTPESPPENTIRAKFKLEGDKIGYGELFQDDPELLLKIAAVSKCVPAQWAGVPVENVNMQMSDGCILLEIEIVLTAAIAHADSLQLRSLSEELNRCFCLLDERISVTKISQKDQLAEIKKHLTCPICLDWLVFSAVTECGHSFCASCIQTFSLEGEKSDYACPTCKGVITRAPSPDYNTDSLVEFCVEKFEGAKGLNAYQKRKENDRTLRRFRSGDTVKCHYVFVGNPGLGKSTLINSFLQRQVFASGPSFGTGLTEVLHKVEVEEGIFVDTPGLDDIKAREKAAEEISKALKLTGSYRLFFVVGLEVGRVRPQDCVTMKLVLDACHDIPEFQSSFRYSIIINKLGPKIKHSIEHDEQRRQEVLAGLFNTMGKKTNSIYYAPKVEDLEEAENEIFEMPKDMKDFISDAPDVLIPSKCVNGVQTSEFEHMQVALETQISDLRQQLDKQQLIIQSIDQEENKWLFKAMNLHNMRKKDRECMKRRMKFALEDSGSDAGDSQPTDEWFDALEDDAFRFML